MKLKNILLLSFVLLFHISFAQLQIVWQQCYGGSDRDHAAHMVKNEAGYLMFGYTESSDGDISYNHGYRDYWLVQTDMNGQLLWEKTYGGSGKDTGYGFGYVPNSEEIILFGKSNSSDGDISFNPYAGYTNLWTAKLDAEKVIIWENFSGVPGDMWYGISGAVTNDGGCILASNIRSPNGDPSNYYGGCDVWVLKKDSLGNTDWDITLGNSGADQIGTSVITVLNDGGFVICMYNGNGEWGTVTCDSNNELAAATFVKIDSLGSIEWQQCYGTEGADVANCAIETEDGLLFACIAGSDDGDAQGAGWHGEGDTWLIKTDFEGNMVWNKCYGGSGTEGANRIFQTSDGGYVVFGNTTSYDGDVQGNHSTQSRKTIWVFKINGTGDLLWQQCIGSHGTDELITGVVQKSDHNYVLAASTRQSPSFDVTCSNANYPGNDRFWLFELNDTLISGASKIIDNLNVLVYPNPAKSFISFELPLSGSTEVSAIEIYNVLAQKVTTINTTIIPDQKQYVWNTENREPGIYYYRIIAGKQSKIGRFIIVR